jgi:two-component system chemotaxis sensor kinase CheA
VSKALRINSCNEDYLLPLEYIASIVSVKADEIHSFQNGFFFKIQDQLIGIRHLEDILYNKSTNLKLFETLLLIVLSIDGKKKALSVDRVIGIQELSIKVLPENLRDLDTYRGCATLSDGRAVLVLNPKKIFE